jgi:hypothetical protein
MVATHPFPVLAEAIAVVIVEVCWNQNVDEEEVVAVVKTNSIQNQTLEHILQEVVVAGAMVLRCWSSSTIHPILAQVPESIDGSKMTAVSVAQPPVLGRSSPHTVASLVAVVVRSASAPVAPGSIGLAVCAEREMPIRQASHSYSVSALAAGSNLALDTSVAAFGSG